MPYAARKINGKYRLIKKDTGKVMTSVNGRPSDGGGGSKEQIERQIRAIAMSEHGNSLKNR